MSEHYPLTGKPFAFATMLDDGATEDTEAARRGLTLPPDLAYSLSVVLRRARERTAEMHEDEHPITERHIAALTAALDRLVQVRVNPTEAARLTGYHRNHIQHMIADGTLYAEREGTHWCIPLAALDRLKPRDSRGRPKTTPPTT